MKSMGFGAIAALAMAVAGAATTAPGVPATDTYFGVAVPDPFRNLEDLSNADTRRWLLEQGDQTAAVLARIEGRDALRERIAALARSGGDVVYGVVRRPGGRLVYMKRAAGQSQFKLTTRDGLAGAERVLVDPEAMARAAAGTPHAINYFAVSNDGRTVAYGVSAGGSENAALQLLDIATGRQLLDAPLQGVIETGLHWSPGDRWLSFNQRRDMPPGTPEVETFFDSTVRVLDRRHLQRAPRKVFGPTATPGLGLDRLDTGELLFARDSPYMIVRTTDTTVPEGKLFLAPVAALGAPGPVPWRQIGTAADKVTDLALRGRTLFFRSYAKAPRGQVLALALPAAGLAGARVVVAAPARGVLQSFTLGRTAVYALVQEGFGSRVFRHDPARPGPGLDMAAGFVGGTWPIVDPQAGADELWLATRSWVTPHRIVATAGGQLRDTGLRRSTVPAGVPELVVTEVEVPSHDGVRVPLAVMHRKGLVLDGRNPTLLDGYGAYGITTTAFFDPRRHAWLEQGGVLAYVNPRGSGAYGDEWHRAGFKATKPNTWKDGIAAARWLIAQGYASPATLSMEGGSAGGIFVGRAITSEPALFSAAIFNVGMMDMVRSELSANGATNTSEFGTVKIEPEFKALLAMSTYHQVKDGTAYPAVLLVHGLNDPRVDVWHSAKAAARLQQATSSGKPVLLRLDAQAGHGIGSTADQAQALQADIWSFLLWQAGRVALKP